MVKHAYSKHRSYLFDSPMCPNKDAIGEEGSIKPSHKVHFPIKKLSVLSLVSSTLKIKYIKQYTYDDDDEL